MVPDSPHRSRRDGHNNVAVERRRRHLASRSSRWSRRGRRAERWPAVHRLDAAQDRAGGAKPPIRISTRTSGHGRWKDRMSQFDLDAKARDIGLEGFNAPAELNALHVWQLAGRKATIRLKRDREFADSPVEGSGFEPSVPLADWAEPGLRCITPWLRRMPRPYLLYLPPGPDRGLARAARP